MFRVPVIVATLAGLWPSLAASCLAAAPIECIATTSVPANLSDHSKLRGRVEDGTPATRLGAWGSAIAYTGHDDLYVVAPDRGPNASTYRPAVDNTTSYQARIETMRIRVNARSHAISVAVVETLLLTNEEGAKLDGLSTDFVANQPSDFSQNRRFDPEGLRVSCDRQHYFVSDEYGPGLFEFDAHSGKRTRIFSLPPRFAIAHPAATAAKEMSGNASGRQANHGLEGLAITPDCRRLLAILQAPLIQDTEVDGNGARIGLNLRLLSIDIESGQTHEFLYQLEDGKQYGVNEILAVNDHQFLVLERDTKAGDKATMKSLFLIDLEGASDVSQVEAFGPKKAPEGVRPVDKRLFLDLLDPQYGLARATFPAKIEGLTFGPDLADGRHLLLVTSDNDFLPVASRVFAFAIARSALPAYKPQQFAAKTVKGETP